MKNRRFLLVSIAVVLGLLLIVFLILPQDTAAGPEGSDCDGCPVFEFNHDCEWVTAKVLEESEAPDEGFEVKFFYHPSDEVWEMMDRFEGVMPGDSVRSSLLEREYIDICDENDIVVEVVNYHREDLVVGGPHCCPQVKLFLPMVIKSPPPPPPCTSRTILVEYEEYTGEMEFERWPGPDYGNITLGYGRVIQLETSDGADISSSLTWYHNDPRGNSWYHYFEPMSEWQFTATFDDESTWEDLTPGHPWELAIWYVDQGTLCNLRFDMQWDPPE